MKKIMLIMFLLVSTTSYAEVTIRPDIKYAGFSLNRYGWICIYKKSQLCISVNPTAADLISKAGIEGYFKEQMKKFVSDYEWIDSLSSENSNFMKIDIELYRYPENREIYYGLVSFEFEAAVAAEYHSMMQPSPYVLVSSVAGRDTQIVQSIKEKLDHMIEMFTEDYKEIEGFALELQH